MATITFTGVSPRSLGDLLKGYGLIALIGEWWPNSQFFFDAAGHLTVKNQSIILEEKWKRTIECFVRCQIPPWARRIGEEFASTRGNKKKGISGEASKLTKQEYFDQFDAELAAFAWAAAIPDEADTRSHPWFGAHGQDGSGNYFATLSKLHLSSTSQPQDDGLRWTLYRCLGSTAAPTKNQLLKSVKSGGVFFPEPMKRYATGVRYWIREGDAPVSPWCYALALYGALSLRGSLRRMRFARSNYPSFPFVFEGADAWEVHLPVWRKKHPRTLREWRMQLAQFQVRVKGDALAANAVEFRAAIAGRGVAARFARFYRFVLERRRPGQKEEQYLQQGILRGITWVGVSNALDVRLLVAPLASRHWLDRLETKRRLPKKPTPDQVQRFECRERVEHAIHAALDEPRPEAALDILRALWATNQVLARQATSASGVSNIPPPVPLLDAAPWERALKPLLAESAEHRIARAIGSILGTSESKEGQQATTGGATATPSAEPDERDGAKRIGGLLWQFLPIDVKHRWSKERGASVVSWRGAVPEKGVAELLWRRWLYSLGAGMRHLAIRSRRTARLEDIARLLRGELNITLIHELVPLYALLDWSRLRKEDEKEESNAESTARTSSREEMLPPISPAYTILRTWLHLAIYPDEDESAEGDGSILHLLATLNPVQTYRAVSRALQRLRIRGLPIANGKERPFGKSVPQASIEVSSELAQRLPMATLVSINSYDTHRLARRLLVQSPSSRKEITI